MPFQCLMAFSGGDFLYNRYIPGPDGEFQKQSIPDKTAPIPPPKPPAPSGDSSKSIGSFLGNLIPAGLDTEDLIVVLLLLLMSENCRESPNTPLITMLIYLFL